MHRAAALLSCLFSALLVPAWAASGTPKTDAVSYVIGAKHFDANDVPTYQIAEDGTADWYTTTGHAAYHLTCHTCHGQRGTGSQYGNALSDPAILARYFDFKDATVNGQIVHHNGRTRIMPAFGTNAEVTCRLDAIYIYLRAETAEMLGATAPRATVAPPEVATQELAACLRN